MLIKLTQIAHPDVNGGKNSEVYIDPTRVLVIERGITAQARSRSVQAHHEAINSLHEEVQRVMSELQNIPSMTVHDEESSNKVDRWIRYREAAASLNAAYGLVAKSANEPMYYPDVYCTTVSLACGTGLEHGVMLARVFVTESPEEVAAKIAYPSPHLGPRPFKPRQE